MRYYLDIDWEKRTMVVEGPIEGNEASEVIVDPTGQPLPPAATETIDMSDKTALLERMEKYSDAPQWLADKVAPDTITAWAHHDGIVTYLTAGSPGNPMKVVMPFTAESER